MPCKPSRLLIVLAALAAVVPLPAAAGPVAACLAQSDADKTGSRRPDGCIGVISGPCLERPENVSAPAQIECLHGEQQEWDAILNQTYQKLLKAAPKTAVQNIRKSQRAWIASRDADCALPYDLVQGGSMYRLLGADCINAKTARRAIEVRDWLDVVAP